MQVTGLLERSLVVEDDFSNYILPKAGSILNLIIVVTRYIYYQGHTNMMHFKIFCLIAHV